MVYIENIYIGLLVFPLIAALITLPYALYQYNKHGSVSKLRTLIIYSFVLYMLIAFFMVSLPLPKKASTLKNNWHTHINLIPCKQFMMFWHNKALTIANIKKYIMSMSLWTLLFNVLLTMPFGVYMRYYFKLSIKKTMLYSFFLSLFYEFSQITGLFWIYPGPYRMADVEDLICNTLGGVLGWQYTYVFTKRLPTRDEIDEKCRVASKTVTGMRRVWSVIFDYTLGSVIFLFLIGTAEILIPGLDNYSIYEKVSDWSFFCVFSLVQVVLTGGSTLGHGICRVVLISEDGRPATRMDFLKRYLYLWLFSELPDIVVGLVTDEKFGFIQNENVILFLTIAAKLYFVLYLINVVFRKGVRMPHEKLSKTKYMVTEAPKADKKK
ncbi:MAG: VanZ family protein [Lachnospiraceae bacterium]|nr:VanZ family protein [Lachnospiraceae bacterium]